MSTLYEIGQDALALRDLLTEIGGDLSDAEVEGAVDAWLAENTEALEEKLDAYGAILRELENDAEFCRKEASRLIERATVRESNVKRMKERLRWHFTAHGLTKVETPRFRFSLAKNGGKQPVAVAVPAESLPAEYRVERVTYSANTDAIREALEKGASLPFASLEERGSHIRVK